MNVPFEEATIVNAQINNAIRPLILTNLLKFAVRLKLHAQSFLFAFYSAEHIESIMYTVSKKYGCLKILWKISVYKTKFECKSCEDQNSLLTNRD